jgi:hypothetical protein
MLTRRRFAFWIGFGLFSLAGKLRVYGLDELAAALMDATRPSPESDAARAAQPIHWRAADNGVWRWFERETFVAGQWKLSGITTPIRMETGEKYEGLDGYLDESLVPEAVRRGDRPAAIEGRDYSKRRATDVRRSRHGRPPSKWLRSLYAQELRVWLKTIEVPEAGVSGMTYWEHLTRDHSFDPVKIEGLTIDEQAKLHAAAHHGY